jgi:hypothetical protein
MTLDIHITSTQMTHTAKLVHITPKAEELIRIWHGSLTHLINQTLRPVLN